MRNDAQPVGDAATMDALAAGLRAIAVAHLTAERAPDAGADSPEERLIYVTVVALTVGRAFELVHVPPRYVMWAAQILGSAADDPALERVARFVATGRGLDA